jgi:succinate dehydrogenase/fumarate reductase flavoprotein subunit
LAPDPAGHITLPEGKVPIVARPDVLVVGGGSAGLSAAVAAARQGADVLLLERFNYLGGLATGGLIILLLTMDDGAGRQVIAGLCQEIVDRMEKRGGVFYPPKDQWNDPDPKLVEHCNRWGLVWGSPSPEGHRVRYSVAFDPHEFIFAADQMVREAGVRVLYQTLGCEPLVEDGRIRAVVIQNKAGRQTIVPRVVIDATGDGDVFAAAGEAFELEAVHPWLWFLMSNVKDMETVLDSKRAIFFRSLGEGHALVPWGGEGRVRRKIDATDPGEVSEALVECRQMVMEEAARLRANVPGFEDAYISLIADQLGITESRRLRGQYVLARDDLDKPFEDVIAVTGHWTKYACVYNIPYRSLLPLRVSNLLAAGRCISADHRAHHATKEIPPCMATGQAAGTAAAMAAATGTDVRTVDVTELQRKLRESGAILG